MLGIMDIIIIEPILVKLKNSLKRGGFLLKIGPKMPIIAHFKPIAASKPKI